MKLFWVNCGTFLVTLLVIYIHIFSSSAEQMYLLACVRYILYELMCTGVIYCFLVNNLCKLSILSGISCFPVSIQVVFWSTVFYKHSLYCLSQMQDHCANWFDATIKACVYVHIFDGHRVLSCLLSSHGKYRFRKLVGYGVAIFMLRIREWKSPVGFFSNNSNHSRQSFRKLVERLKLLSLNEHKCSYC